MVDFNESFNDSYERVFSDPTVFFDEFYAIFINRSEEIQRLFSETDMEVQKRMLRKSISLMISFFTTRQAGDYLVEIADLHRNKLKISPELYAVWMDSIIDTLEKLDPKFDKNAEISWRITLSPGIEFMKHYAK